MDAMLHLLGESAKGFKGNFLKILKSKDFDTDRNVQEEFEWGDFYVKRLLIFLLIMAMSALPITCGFMTAMTVPMSCTD